MWPLRALVSKDVFGLNLWPFHSIWHVQDDHCLSLDSGCSLDAFNMPGGMKLAYAFNIEYNFVNIL